MKALLRGLCSLIFKLSVYGLATATAVVIVFGTAAPLKHALHQSNIYDQVVDQAIAAAQKPEDGSAITTDPTVISTAKQAFPASSIQQNVEKVIDSVYAWLQGKTATPTFTLNLISNQQTFTDLISQHANQRFQGLPACTLQQSRALAVQGPIDPLNVDCRPPGVTSDTINQLVAANVSAYADQLNAKTTISSQNLPKDAHGQTIFDRIKAVPPIFRLLMLGPWIFGGLAALAATGLVFLHDNRRRGIRNLAVMLIVIGVIIALSCFVFDLVFNHLSSSGGPLSQAGLSDFQKPLVSVLDQLSRQFNHVLYLFAAIYGAIGIITLVGLRMTRSKQLSVATSKSKA